MDQEEALQSLELVRQAAAQTRQAIARSGTGYFFIIWGAVWFLGFLASQLLGERSGYVWFGLDALGGVASAVVGVRAARRVRTTHGRRMGLFWLIVLVYGGLQLWIVSPLSGDRFMMFITLLVSFGYALFGLWVSPHLLGAGIGTAALAVLGWLLLPGYIGYWMAFLGGGGMIAFGAYILLRWK